MRGDNFSLVVCPVNSDASNDIASYSNLQHTDIAIRGMLKTVGFKRVEFVSELRPLWFRVGRAAYYWWKRDHRFWSAVHTYRVVVHAWK